MDLEFDRAHFRITYPIVARPTLDWGIRALVVLDVSEHGLRFVTLPRVGLQVGTAIKGSLRFPSGETAEVSGKVVWVINGEAGVQFSVGIPYRVIVEEQLYLQRRFATAE